MSTVYIASHHGRLQKDGDILVHSDHTGLTTKLIPSMTDCIIVIGMMDVTGAALNVCIEKRIPIFFLRFNGKFNGKLVFDDGKNTLLRHKQHLTAENEKFAFSMAKSIVLGKTLNEYLFMQRIQRKLPDNKEINDCLIQVKRIRKSLEELDSKIESIRGFEGSIARLYFKTLGYNFICEWTKFNGRIKNPPRDEVNATLSFLYTLLASKVDTEIILEGLDDSVGTLHDFSYGRKSLVFDLMEEFRTPLVDTTVCAMFNQGTLTANDFRKEKGIDGDTVVLLNESGIRKAISSFEKKLEQNHEYLYTGKTTTYQNIIKHQVEQYKQYLRGELDRYQPQIVT